MAVKIYLVYDHPWWRDIISSVTDRQNQTPRSHGNIQSDLPLHWTYDFGVSAKTGKAVLLVAYTSNPMWRELQKHGDRRWAGHYSVSTEAIRHTHLYLSKLYNIPVTTIPFPIDGRISQWDENPYNGSFFIWKTGVDWGRVWRTVNKPSALDDVFIASGAYWNYQSDAWSENCLNAINEMLQKYF
ncbi:Achacin [Mizuhopecten yessoensis]|uniref:Achacin n=2 Tax=Mizuhopecten yessoensis TaxID=6573 RepID=A0A210QPE3_MIZYE|nr:Achacin [Mizuhopecten yessoensis]